MRIRFNWNVGEYEHSVFVPGKLSARSTISFRSSPHVTRQRNRDHSALRIVLVRDDLFRTPSLSVTLAYVIALRYCFGFARKAVDIYFADDSGSQSKPIDVSNTKPPNRVYRRTHERLLHGLLGTGLVAVSDRFDSLLIQSTRSLDLGEEWTTFPDLSVFFEDSSSPLWS